MQALTTSTATVDTSRPPVRRLWLSVLGGYLALGATLQILPTYVERRFQAGPATVGLLVGIAFAATALLRPFAGRAGDAGLARRTVLAGAALTAAAGVGHLLAPTPLLVGVARVVMGFGEAALFSGALPWVLAGAAPDRRGRVTGWFGLSMWSGLAIGPVAAAAVTRWVGATASWSVVVALPLLSVLLLATTRRSAVRPGARVVPRAWREIVPAGAGLPGLLLGLAAYGYGTLSALLVLFLVATDRAVQGYGLGVFAVAFLASRTVGSPWVDRLGARTVLRAALAVEGVGLAGLPCPARAPRRWPRRP